jgi:hypothetical protein
MMKEFYIETEVGVVRLKPIARLTPLLRDGDPPPVFSLRGDLVGDFLEA